MLDKYYDDFEEIYVYKRFFQHIFFNVSIR